MPIFNARLSDGRVVKLEAEEQPSEADVLAAVDQYEKDLQPTALGAAARSFGTSVGPTGVGMAAAAPLMPWAVGAAPASFGTSLLVPLVAGGIAAYGAEKAQKPLLKKVFPGLEAQQQADIEQQKLASMGGRLAAVAPFAEFSPVQGIKALASIPKALLGSPEAKKAVGNLALNVGLQEALTTGTTIASEGRFPTGAEMGESALAGGLFGKMRGPLGRIAGQEAKPPAEQVAEIPPEVRVSREQELVKRAGEQWTFTDQPLGKPRDIANTKKDGGVLVNRSNFHTALEKELSEGRTVEEALDTIISEESIHGATRTLEGGDALAKSYWNDLTSMEKWIEKRRYHGPGYKGDPLSEEQYGHEAIRFALQRALRMQPGEFVFGDPADIRTARLLTKLGDVVRWIREKLGTKASQRQLAILDQVQGNLDAYRKGNYASRITGPESAAEREVRPRVGEEAPLRQQGEAAEAQAPVEVQKEVLLTPDHEEIISGLKPGEKILESAVWMPGMKQPAYGPHHPGILQELEKQFNKPGLSDQYKTKKSRNNRLFGYRTNLREFVPRTELRLKATGKMPHSDDVPSVTGVGTVADQPQAPKVVSTFKTAKGSSYTLHEDGTTTRTKAARKDHPGDFGLKERSTKTIFVEPKVAEDILDNANSLWEDGDWMMWLDKDGNAVGGVVAPRDAQGVKKVINSSPIQHSTKPAKGLFPVEFWQRKGRSKYHVGNEITELSEAPPSAPTGEAQTGQAPPGLATAPPAALTAGGPAAKGSISTTPTPVQQGRLAELRKLLNTKGYTPSMAELEEFAALTAPERKAALASRAAKRAGGPPPETGMPAMPRRGRDISDEELVQMVAPIVMKGASTHTPDEIKATMGKLVHHLATLPADARNRELVRFQIVWRKVINDRVQKMLAQDDPKLVKGESSAETKRLIAQAKAQGFKGNILVTDIPPITRQSLEEGMIGHLNRTPNPRQIQAPVDEEGKPIDTKEWQDTGKLDKEGRSIWKKKPGKLQKEGEPESKAVRQYWDVPDYPSFVRAVRSQEDLIAGQTGELKRTPEAYIRMLWNENVPDILNNMSREQLGALMKAEGSKRINPETGKYAITLAEPDADSILEGLERQYPEPGRPVTDPRTGEPLTWEMYKSYNKYTTDDQAKQAIKVEKDKAWTELKRFAQTRRLTENEAFRVLEEIQKSEMVEGYESMEKGHLKEEIRKGIEQIKRNRARVVGYLSERLMKDAEPPESDPNRLALAPDDIEAYKTYTEAQSNDLKFLRDDLWLGSQVKGKTVSRFTKGVVILDNTQTGQRHAVSLYLHPTSKEVMVYDPNFIPGDKQQEHIPLESLMAGPWRIRSVILVRSPLEKYHQLWKNESAFNKDIGWAAKLNESVLEERAAKAQKEISEGELEEEEVAGEEPAEPIAGETEKEKEARERLESRKAGVDKPPEREESEAERQSRIEEETGARPGEAGYEEPPAEPTGFQKSQDIAVLKAHEEGKHIKSGYDLIIPDKTNPYQMAKGFLTPIEAEAIANTFSEREILARRIEKLGIVKTEKGVVERTGREFTRKEGTTIRPISGAEDILDLLKRMNLRRKHPSWFTGKPRGVRGQDAAFASGISKVIRAMEASIKRTPDVRMMLRKFPKIPKDTPYNELAPMEKAHWDFLQDIKDEAKMAALDKIYAIAQNHRLSPEAIKKGAFPYNEESFRTEALALYGDTVGRDLERAALQARRAAQQESISGERTLLAGAKFTGTPRTRAAILAKRPEQIPGPPEKIDLPAQAYVRGEAEKRYGKGGQPPFEMALTSPMAKKGEVVPERPMGEYLRKTYAAQARQPFIPKGLPPGMLRPSKVPPKMRGKGIPAPEQYPPGTFKEMEQAASTKLEDSTGAEGSQWGTPAIQLRGKEDVHGVANKYWPGIKSSWEHMTQDELVSQGKENWKSWEDTYRMMKMAKEGGGLNLPMDAAVARYGGFLLDKRADQIAKTAGPKSEAYKAAQIDSEKFQQEFHDIFKTPTSYTMLTFKGETNLDTGYTVFRREFKERTGREPTAEEDDFLFEIAGEVDEAKASRGKAEADYGDELAKPDPGEELEGPLKGMAAPVENQADKLAQEGMDAIDRLFGEEPAMAMKGVGPVPLTPQALEALSKVGSKIMQKLSKLGKLDYGTWKEEMRKLPKIGNRFDQNLEQVYVASRKFRDEFINRIVGQGDATKPLKNLYTRERPSVKQSLEAISRAVAVDPQGKWITRQEAYHIWNIVKQQFVDKGIRDPEEVRIKASQFIGFGTDKVYPEIRIYRALSTNKTLRALSQEVIKRQRDETRIINNAKNWLKNQEYPGWLQFIRRVPRWFFMDKIFGHGLVPLVTHSGNMMFNPYAWRTYFPAWRDMYRMTFGERPISRHLLGKPGLTSEEYHKMRLSDLTNHESFEMWRGAGLQVDPFRYTDDYQIAALQGFMAGKTGSKIKRGFERAVTGWGFDALKTLRLARANQWWDLVPEHLKTKQMAELIADSVNHSTGIVKTKFPEVANWLLFAPKLEASRWAFLFKDTIKAADYLRQGNRATPEQRLWAQQELRQKAVMVGMFMSALAASQGLLWAVGSDEKINIDDPSKPDFLYFKVPGFRFGVTTPFIGMFKLFANLLHAGQGELRPLEKMEPRQSLMDTDIGKYVRGKFSPFASFAYDVASGQDPTGRPLPWSSDVIPRSRRLKGVEQYGWTEWGMQAGFPIPAEEVAREMWDTIGMDDTTASKLIKTLKAVAVGGVMMGTGARVTQTTPE